MYAKFILASQDPPLYALRDRVTGRPGVAVEVA